MEWQDLQDGVKAWLALEAGIPAHQIAWDGEAETHRGYPRADLQLLGHTSEGMDETVYVPDKDGLIVEVHGNRLVTLVISWQSRDQRGPTKGFSVLERMRTQLERPDTIAAFDALGVSIRDASVTVDAGKVKDLREESAATLRVTLAYTVVDRDEENLEVSIEHVQLGGDIYTPGAVVVPDKIIP
jgi:hypothetical protein